MSLKIIDTASGTFYIRPDFSIRPGMTKGDFLPLFGKKTLPPGLEGYSSRTIPNLKIGEWYFVITFYFKEERLTHFTFGVYDKPMVTSSWDDYDPNAEKDYRTNWMQEQLGDPEPFVWDLDIAGRQYHRLYDWGSAGVYFDFKDYSFSCVITY